MQAFLFILNKEQDEGIFLDQDYILNKAMLTEEEQQKIVLALKSISATGQLENKALTKNQTISFLKNMLILLK